MLITTQEKKVTEQKSVSMAVYRDSDIKELIKANLEARGYTVKNIVFKTDYGYASDEWGMISHIKTEFIGAEAELEE